MKVVISFLTLCLFTCCNGTVDKNKCFDCKETYHKAISHLNNYYLDSNKIELTESLLLADTALLNCVDYKVKFINLKITLLMLLGKYEEGALFIDLIAKEDFEKPYEKSLFSNTFRALMLEKQGNIFSRDSCYQKATLEIEEYLKINPDDKNAILDLTYTRLKYIDILTVLSELKKSQNQNAEDYDFYEALIETIKTIPK